MLTACFSSKATSGASLQCLARELTRGRPGVLSAGSGSEAGAASSFPRQAQSQPRDFTRFGPDGKVWWDHSRSSSTSQRATSARCCRASATRFEQEDEDSSRNKWRAANSCWQRALVPSTALTQGRCFMIKLREQGYLGNLKLS